MEKRQSLKQMALGKLKSDMKKNETGRLFYTIHKNKLTMDERPKCEIGNHQNPTREHWQQPLTQHVSGGKGNKSKNKLGPHQNKNLLHSEGNNHQN